jgi:hypothetical protein
MRSCDPRPASAASSGTGRTVELEQVSINNIARIEVYKSPLPESPCSTLPPEFLAYYGVKGTF